MKSLVRDVSTKSLFSDRNTRNPFIIELHLHLQHKKSICSNLQNKKKSEIYEIHFVTQINIAYGIHERPGQKQMRIFKTTLHFWMHWRIGGFEELDLYTYNGEMKDHGWSAHQMLKKRKSKSIYKFEIEQKLLLNGTRERKWRACKKVKKGF